MSHKQASELLHEYAAGAVTDEERRLVEAHLASGCPECLAELREVNRALVLLTEADGLIAPPDGLKESILSRIREQPSTTPTGVGRRAAESTGGRQRRRRVYAASAIAASVLLTASAVPWLLWRPPPAAVDANRQAKQDFRGPALQFVRLALPPSERRWLKHALFDGLSGELHVWVLTRDEPNQARPTHVQILDDAGTRVAAVALIDGAGVAGAVIAAQDVPKSGTLEVGAGPPGDDGSVILESTSFQLR